jgi:hypothetical protein
MNRRGSYSFTIRAVLSKRDTGNGIRENWVIKVNRVHMQLSVANEWTRCPLVMTQPHP